MPGRRGAVPLLPWDHLQNGIVIHIQNSTAGRKNQ
uniref:Uncharacterized protein n=1 Tax=Siphoviridae sp. ctKNZ79 TaxID=2825440 RepID=A0A8S5U9K3_9CAUD|nr:MAG TPA: hypothetical protein [Siphoviridae sp. ctKNZ79]